MEQQIAPLARLAEQFGRLPGIGRKSAQRLAYFTLHMSAEEANAFAEAIVQARTQVRRCAVCCDLTDQELCAVCRSATRDGSILCVVEDPRDVAAIERTHEYRGLYHVLHGVISPLNGIGPEALTVKELLRRFEDDLVSEVIMATNPTVEGEATAIYLARLLKPLGVQVSRLAYGVPVGAELEYADEVTLARALEGRRRI
ncbi:MAG: recombination mediator RecR [Oscillospiraceae bacterium]|jgi:recombination protein RecR|nr:recombination mediator RecR [Oscillospiraceae bacterium]